MQVSVGNVGTNSATVYIVTDSAYTWYRILVQNNSTAYAYLDVWYTSAQLAAMGYAVTVTGIPSGVYCKVTAQYNNSGQGGGGSWMPPVYFTTAVMPSGTLYYMSNGGYFSDGSTTMPFPVSGNMVQGADGNLYIPTSVASIYIYRDGYTLLGWSTYSTATSASYFYGSAVNVPVNGSLYLYAVWKKNDADGGVYIWNGSTWVKATPHIWNGSTWVKAVPHIWNGSWQKGV